MKKLLMIGLAVVLVLGLATVGMADGAPEVIVNFNGQNPDVNVTAYKAGPSGDWSWSGTAQFTLTGTGSAVGSVTGSLDGEHWTWNSCPGQPTVSGGYTATNGDFQSEFSAFSYEWVGYGSAGAWSTQSVNAIGLPDTPIIIDPHTATVSGGSMTVNGDATAVYGGGSSLGGFTESGQTFSGEATSVTVYGDKMWSPNIAGYDPLTWDPSTFQGANFTATASDSSTVTFVGAMEGRTYPQGGETSSCRVLTKQGLGFDIDVGSSVNGELWTKYAYTNMLAFDDAGNSIGTQITFDEGLAIIEAFNADRIVGETSTPVTDFSGGGYGEWEGVPGYILP